MNSKLIESVTAGVLIIASLLLVNPFGLWMPSMFHMSMLAVLVAAIGTIAVFMLRERASDEREEAHRMHAGRAAFFTGAGILVAGVSIQLFAHDLDPWLVAALVGMVIAKVAARWWSDSHR